MTASIKALFATTVLLWHAIVNSGNEHTTIDIRLAVDSVKVSRYAQVAHTNWHGLNRERSTIAQLFPCRHRRLIISVSERDISSLC